MRAGEGPFAEMFQRRGLRWEPQETSSYCYLRKQDAFTIPTIAVHCIHSDPEDAVSMAADGVSVAHCPRSNAKLGAGIAPIADYLRTGIDVGLGTDSPLTANSMDFFEEIRAMVYQSRLRGDSPSTISTRRALEIATNGGARSLMLEKTTGRLAPGLAADLIGVRLDGVPMAPAAEDNPEAALVYSGRPSDVAWTMVGGKVVQENGIMPQMDIVRLQAELVRRRREIVRRRGLLREP